MIDEPSSTTQEQDPRTIVLTQERQLVDEPQLLPAMKHRKERRRQKDGKQFEEVLSTVCLLAPSVLSSEYPGRPENLVVDHPLKNLVPGARMAFLGTPARRQATSKAHFGRFPVPGGSAPSTAERGCDKA